MFIHQNIILHQSVPLSSENMANVMGPGELGWKLGRLNTQNHCKKSESCVKNLKCLHQPRADQQGHWC